MLTRKQKDLLLLIHDRLESDGVPPSFDEMKDALGLKSKSGIHRLITGLEERGFIRRLPHRARALEITRMPDMQLPALPDGDEDSPPHVPAAFAAAQSISLPLYGRIAAGTPIEALRDPTSSIDVPTGLLAQGFGHGKAGKTGGAAEHYALEISGDSMIEAGIMDGDTAIIRTCDTADNGAIVVALVDEAEATLKTIERRGDRIALIPANRAYETRLLPASSVRVQGRLVGLMRRY